MSNYFIVNKASRTGKAEKVWQEIEGYLEANHIEYEVHFTEKAFDATEYAKEASQKPGTLLFVMGGDGTINEALNGIEHFENIEFVCLPSGSANDFAKGVGINGDAIDILKRALSTNDSYEIDLGQIEYNGQKRVFGVSTGIGVDAFVCLQALDSKLKNFLNRIGLGSATYGLLTVGDLFTMPLSDAQLIYDGNVMEVGNVIFIASMNCPYEGGGIPMVPYAKADSGKLSAMIAHDISRIKCFGMLPLLVAGKHQGRRGMDFIDFNEMTIKMKNPMCVHADGEHIDFLSEVTVRCLTKILKIRGM